MTEALRVALAAADAFERCGLRYVVGGSIASSIMGEPRSTLDVDVALELPRAKIPALAAALGPGFYFDVAAAQQAVVSGSSTSAIHEATGIKLDLFMIVTPLDHAELQRRKRMQVGGAGEELYICTPEDILLQKLRWYRMGNEISDRQWRDVLGILLAQAPALDRAYMRVQAQELGLTDLLDCALAAAGIE